MAIDQQVAGFAKLHWHHLAQVAGRGSHGCADAYPVQYRKPIEPPRPVQLRQLVMAIRLVLMADGARLVI